MPYSTVLQAEQQLFPAELELAAARGQALASVIAIYRSMGGGWVDRAARDAPQPAPGEGWLSPRLSTAKPAP
jgi:multidrug efflux system outer membrane protein